MDTYYPEWKGWVWRFLRTAVSGGASTVVATTVVLHLDLSNFKVYSTAIASAFIAGFISSAALALRDLKGDPDKSEGVVNKLPI
jgi:hypothetical protein